MIFKHKLLSESVVMKEFEKVAINKGLVKIDSISKIASFNNEINLNPSNNIFIDMLNLANGLRSKGFDKEAIGLEEKIFNYKTAETHLYRAIDEDAEDMLEFAHPKKNKIKFEAKDGNGDFEDTRSQHEKMLAIVNKKNASKYDSILNQTEEILGLKKKADLDSIDEKIANINFFKNKIIQLLNIKPTFYFATRSGILANTDDVLFAGSPKDSLGFPLIENNNISIGQDEYEKILLIYFKHSNDITESIWKSFLNKEVSFNEIVSDDAINHANNNLEKLYKDFFNKINSLPQIKKENGKINQEVLNKFFDIIHSLFDENSEFMFKALTSNDGKLENQIRSTITEIINNAKSLQINENKSINEMDEILSYDWGQVIANRFNSIFNSATKTKDSDPSYFKHIADIIMANVNKPYKELYNQLVVFDKDLTSATDKNKLDLIAQKWQEYFSKKANLNSKIIKESREIPTDKPIVPAQFSRPVTHTNKQVAPKQISTFQQNNPEEYDAVSKMQTAIHVLADSLNQLFPKEDPKILTEWTSALTSTGYGLKGPKAEPIDGEWGPGTEKALKIAQTILEKLGSKEQLTTEAQRIKGEAVHDTKDIVNLASANINQIYQILNNHNIDYKGKAQNIVLDDDKSPYIDSLPSNVNIFGEINDKEDPNSGLTLSKEDLASFYNFFKFLKLHDLISQDKFSINDWEKIVRWFYNRANKQLIETKKKSKAIYKLLIEKLYGKFQDFIENNPSAQSISAKDIDVNKTIGPTIPTKSNQNAEGLDQEESVSKIYPPPFGYKFDLINMHNTYGAVMNSYDSYANLVNDVTFNVDDFGFDPTSIATTYIKLPINEILKLNNINPNQIVPNLIIQNKPITYEQLFTYFTTNPYVSNIKAKAYDIALYKVCSGLLNDLSNVMTYWKRHLNPPQQSIDYVDNAWKKWSDTLRRTLGRINQDITQNGLSPSMQGSY